MTKSFVVYEETPYHTESITVWEEEPRVYEVRYPRSDREGYFRVKLRQRPNPIGFHARLPGDKR